MSADQVFELIKPIVMDVLLLHLTDQMMEDWEADSQWQQLKCKFTVSQQPHVRWFIHSWLSNKTEIYQMRKDVSWYRISSDVALTCVCADVAAQQPRPGESLSTGGAHTGQGVWADVHLQSPEAGVFFWAVLAEEGWPGCCDGGLPLLLFLRGTDMRHNAGAFHPLARGICVYWLGAGGVWGASFIFLSTTAGAAAEAGRGAEVQGPRNGRRLCLGGGQVEGGQDTQVPHQTCCEAGGSGGVVPWWELSKRIPLQWSVWDKEDDGSNIQPTHTANNDLWLKYRKIDNKFTIWDAFFKLSPTAPILSVFIEVVYSWVFFPSS